LHGLPNILRSKYILIKFFWFILFLAAFSLSIYFLINTKNGNLIFPLNKYDRKYFDQIKQAGYEYSQSLCISFCQLDKIGSNCTFRASSINAPNNMDNFCPNKELSVLNDTWGRSVKLYLEYFNNKQIDQDLSMNQCPLECKTEKYDKFLTSSQIKSMFFLNETNSLVLNIAFDSLSYLNYEESPSISVYNLISNIGGVICLLLGMSLLSIFEVFEMVILNIILIIKHNYKKIKQQKMKKSSIV
jgi:hypothetical protein